VALKLADPARAAEFAQAERDLNPSAAGPYSRLSAALQAAGHIDDSLVALWDGYLITSDDSLRQQLADRYSGDASFGSCVQSVHGGPELNLTCPIIHRQICSAAEQSVGIILAAGHRDAAFHMRDLAAEKFGCDPAPLNKALGGPSVH
jgi:hypothetical protein